MHRYLEALMDPFVSLLEMHKLMYFMQEAGEGLKLQYTKCLYGPYAVNLRHVLTHIKGHFIQGYADAKDAPDKQINCSQRLSSRPQSTGSLPERAEPLWVRRLRKPTHGMRVEAVRTSADSCCLGRCSNVKASYPGLRKRHRMPASDTSEKGLEKLIVSALTGTRSDAAPTEDADEIRDPRIPYGGAGYVLGDPQDYDRDHAVDLAKLLTFLQATQPQVFEQLGLDS